MTDPKMLALTSAQKMMWITLLCLVSSSENDSSVKNITEDRLKILSGITALDEEWEQTDGTLKKFEDLTMIKVNGETIEVINFQKRQLPQDSYDPDAIKERVKRFRNKDKSFQETEGNDRIDKIRIDKIRIDKNIYTDEFNNFWLVYPRKIGKGEAFRSWGKIKSSSALQEKIIKAVKIQKEWEQWQRDEGRFIPNPSTWLNQRRWDDEANSQTLQDIQTEDEKWKKK